MDLEILILCEVSQKDKYNDTVYYVEAQKRIEINFIYRIEIDSQTLKTNLWTWKGGGGRIN